eukprot:1602132-Rhodomonas_salina.1
MPQTSDSQPCIPRPNSSTPTAWTLQPQRVDAARSICRAYTRVREAVGARTPTLRRVLRRVLLLTAGAGAGARAGMDAGHGSNGAAHHDKKQRPDKRASGGSGGAKGGGSRGQKRSKADSDGSVPVAESCELSVAFDCALPSTLVFCVALVWTVLVGVRSGYEDFQEGKKKAKKGKEGKGNRASLPPPAAASPARGTSPHIPLQPPPSPVPFCLPPSRTFELILLAPVCLVFPFFFFGVAACWG